MPSARYDLSIGAARAGALFASPLQRSDEPSAWQVRQATRQARSRRQATGPGANVPATHTAVRIPHRCLPAARVHHPDRWTEYRNPTT